MMCCTLYSVVHQVQGSQPWLQSRGRDSDKRPISEGNIVKQKIKTKKTDYQAY